MKKYNFDWDSVNISDKISYLKELIINKTDFKLDELHIINALITGSHNQYSGDMAFEIKSHHINYLRTMWDLAIKNQKDESVINRIRETILLTSVK